MTLFSYSDKVSFLIDQKATGGIAETANYLKTNYEFFKFGVKIDFTEILKL